MLLIFTATRATALIPSSAGTVDACYRNGNGRLRVIDAEDGKTCNNRETAISWDQSGSIGQGGSVLYSGNTSLSVSSPGVIIPFDGDGKANKQILSQNRDITVTNFSTQLIAPSNNNEPTPSEVGRDWAFSLNIGNTLHQLCTVVSTETECTTSSPNITIPANSLISLQVSFGGIPVEDLEGNRTAFHTLEAN